MLSAFTRWELSQTGCDILEVIADKRWNEGCKAESDTIAPQRRLPGDGSGIWQDQFAVGAAGPAATHLIRKSRLGLELVFVPEPHQPSLLVLQKVLVPYKSALLPELHRTTPFEYPAYDHCSLLVHLSTRQGSDAIQQIFLQCLQRKFWQRTP